MVYSDSGVELFRPFYRPVFLLHGNKALSLQGAGMSFTVPIRMKKLSKQINQLTRISRNVKELIEQEYKQMQRVAP